jgi:hypothetical protein
MKQQSQYSFPELQEALSNGYNHFFTTHANGSLKCSLNPSRHYEPHEVHIKAITCLLNRATLYLISTQDGLYKGVMVDYWEC